MLREELEAHRTGARQLGIACRDVYEREYCAQEKQGQGPELLETLHAATLGIAGVDLTAETGAILSEIVLMPGNGESPEESCKIFLTQGRNTTHGKDPSDGAGREYLRGHYMRRRLVVAIPLLSLVTLLAWVFRPKHESLGEVYVSDRDLTVWSSVAQVREPLGTLHFGEKVELLSRRNENARVRSPAGTVGWVDGTRLMEPNLWQRSAQLLARVNGMPAQARGRTTVRTNLHVEPGRTQPRLFQFLRGVPVEVVGRAVADWTQSADEREPGGGPQEARKGDWFLIRGVADRGSLDATTRPDKGPSVSEISDQPMPVAGWVVARFVELDLPGPVREETASANIRPLAWFELNRVPDASGDKPQYLVAGTRGPEGHPCDFTTVRVYTWNARRTRYETAFIVNRLCGRLPITVRRGPKEEPEFRFKADDGEERVYRLIQTVVRRVRESEPRGRRPSRPAKSATK